MRSKQYLREAGVHAQKMEQRRAATRAEVTRKLNAQLAAELVWVVSGPAPK